MKGHSERCSDLTTRWRNNMCVKCPLLPGHEVSPNCGYDDDGGLHELPQTRCRGGTFNDGSWARCRSCTSCPPGDPVRRPCSTSRDTECGEPRHGTTTETAATSQHVPAVFCTAATIQTNQGSSLTPNATAIPATFYPAAASSDVLIKAVPLAVLLCMMLVMLPVCVIFMKRKRGLRTVTRYSRRSSYVNTGFSPLPSPPGRDYLENILSPDIQSAPLKAVLDNLDVLEELVILLDPEDHGVKNTKHLASHCSFPSTWITYTYSMKDSKSPLKTVLEGVTSRHPDWTVGHLAKLLRCMERNDAIAVLAKLRLNEMDMEHSLFV